MSGGTPAPVPPAPGGFPLGGAGAAAGLTVVVAGVTKPGDISTTFDVVSKRAAPRDDQGCRECQPNPMLEEAVVYKRTNAIYRFDLLRIRLYVSWQFNGCDVLGATFALDSPDGTSVARLGWGADVTGKNLETDTTGISRCRDCCERCACVSFQYSITAKPPFLLGTRVKTGIVTVCGNGIKFP